MYIILSNFIFAIDPHTRVPLFLKFGVANSSYINANYIRVRSELFILCVNLLVWI